MGSLKQREFNNILIIGAIGIGNLLMFRPALKYVRTRYPQARISILVLKRFFAELFTHDPLIDEVIAMDVKEHASLGSKLRAIHTLRSRHYDLVMTTFPANRLEYNLVAFLTGAPVRVAHRYPIKRWSSFSFLQNVRVPLQPGIHDVEQNLSLLGPLGIRWKKEELKIEFPLTDQEREFGPQYLSRLGIEKGRPLIGIHPGSSAEHNMVYKRWAPEKFASLIDIMAKELNARILVFGGPDEEELKAQVKTASSSTPEVVSNLNLQETAAVISTCRLFISNDSGLMHIAVAMGVRTIGIFGPTDHVRTAPFGPDHMVVRKGEPVWALEEVGTRKLDLTRVKASLERLSVEEVWQAVQQVWCTVK